MVMVMHTSKKRVNGWTFTLFTDFLELKNLFAFWMYVVIMMSHADALREQKVQMKTQVSLEDALSNVNALDLGILKGAQ